MKKTIIILFATCSYFACKKEDDLGLPKNTPVCIKDTVEVFKDTEAICEGYHVSKFDTQIGNVYAFTDGNCVSDGGSRIFDEQCNLICFLGGIGGISNCIVGVDTLNLTNEVIIWSK